MAQTLGIFQLFFVKLTVKTNIPTIGGTTCYQTTRPQPHHANFGGFWTDGVDKFSL